MTNFYTILQSGSDYAGVPMVALQRFHVRALHNPSKLSENIRQYPWLPGGRLVVQSEKKTKTQKEEAMVVALRQPYHDHLEYTVNDRSTIVEALATSDVLTVTELWRLVRYPTYTHFDAAKLKISQCPVCTCPWLASDARAPHHHPHTTTTRPLRYNMLPHSTPASHPNCMLPHHIHYTPPTGTHT